MTDTIVTDPFNQTTNEQVNYLDVAKTKFHNASGELDIEGLAKGKYESDKHISRLEEELAAVRAKAEQGMAIKDLYEALKSNPPTGGEPTPPAQVTDPTAIPTDITKLVKDTINQTALEQREAQNKATVVAKLNETYGANAGAELGKKALELGVSVKYLEDTGKASPQALFALLGLNTQVRAPGSSTVPTGRVNITSTVSGDRTKKYYDELYRQNPSLKYDPKTAAQEHRDAIKLGEQFFDT